MKISYNGLREYAAAGIPADTLAYKLTREVYGA